MLGDYVLWKGRHRGCNLNQRFWLSIIQSNVHIHDKVFFHSKFPKHCECSRWSQIMIEVIMQFNIDIRINSHFQSLASNPRCAENKREMRTIKGCWFRKFNKKQQTNNNQKITNQKAAAAAAIDTIQTALQRFHHCHLAPQLSGCFVNTQDKQTCGLSFRVADLGLSNSQETQSFELECLSQEKKHQFPVLASHPTGAGCQLPAGKGEVCAQRRKL